ncbi:MAG: TolC family protein [Candidatus Eisenbacteria bacterium]
MNRICATGMWLMVVLLVPVCAHTAPGETGISTSPGDSLDLQQCLEIALKNSRDIAISKGDVTKSEINLKDARAGFMPDIDLSGGYNVTDTYDRLEWNENHYSLSLNASMTPFNGGRTWINTAKSRESLASAKQSYRLTEIGLILDVMRKYYSLLETTEILKLREESLVQRRTHFDFARARFDLGLVPRADILKAEADVIAAEIDSLEALGNLGLAHAELNDAMGIDLDHPTQVASTVFEREPPPDVKDCVNEASLNRPELLQQRANVSIKQSNVRLAQIDRWPTLTLSGTYDAYIDAFVFDDLPLNRTNWEDNSDWRVGVGLRFPLFDGGVAGRAVRAARIDLHEAELGYTQWRKEVDLEVKLAHLNLVTSFKKTDLTRKEVESAEESYNTALGRYAAGIAPITEVIDAGVALSNSKVGHTMAIYDYHLNKAVLRQAMGRLPYELAGRAE